jgi:hypothetical protein
MASNPLFTQALIVGTVLLTSFGALSVLRNAAPKIAKRMAPFLLYFGLVMGAASASLPAASAFARARSTARSCCAFVVSALALAAYVRACESSACA